MKKLKFIAILMIVGLFTGCEIEPEEDYLEPHNTSTGGTVVVLDVCGTIVKKYSIGSTYYFDLRTDGGTVVTRSVHGEVWGSYNYPVGANYCHYVNR
jgi:hypothetical protein